MHNSRFSTARDLSNRASCSFSFSSCFLAFITYRFLSSPVRRRLRAVLARIFRDAACAGNTRCFNTPVPSGGFLRPTKWLRFRARNRAIAHLVFRNGCSFAQIVRSDEICISRVSRAANRDANSDDDYLNRATSGAYHILYRDGNEIPSRAF